MANMKRDPQLITLVERKAVLAPFLISKTSFFLVPKASVGCRECSTHEAFRFPLFSRVGSSLVVLTACIAAPPWISIHIKPAPRVCKDVMADFNHIAGGFPPAAFSAATDKCQSLNGLSTSVAFRSPPGALLLPLTPYSLPRPWPLSCILVSPFLKSSATILPESNSLGGPSP
ncbi:hypothetical protein VTI74DRAFT_5710 [Chaetomium olivicolor]